MILLSSCDYHYYIACARVGQSPHHHCSPRDANNSKTRIELNMKLKMKSNKRNGKQKLSRSSFSELKTRALDYGAIVASKLPRAWRKYPGAPVVAIHS